MVSVHWSEGWSAHVVRRPSVGNFSCFDFFFKTVEQRKLDRNQELTVLHQVSVSGQSKRKLGTPVSHWLRHFRILFWNQWTEFSEMWQEARTQNLLPSLCFTGRSQKRDRRPASNGRRHFRLLLCNRWTEFYETWEEARYQPSLPGLFFRPYQKTKMVALVS